MIAGNQEYCWHQGNWNQEFQWPRILLLFSISPLGKLCYLRSVPFICKSRNLADPALVHCTSSFATGEELNMFPSGN